MAKKLGKVKPTKSNEEESPTVLLNNNNNQLIETSTSIKSEKSLINSNNTNIIIRETISPTNSNNGSLSSTKAHFGNLSIKDKSTIKENLCKEEIVEGFSFLTFLSYSDLEVSFRFFIIVKLFYHIILKNFHFFLLNSSSKLF